MATRTKSGVDDRLCKSIFVSLSVVFFLELNNGFSCLTLTHFPLALDVSKLIYDYFWLPRGYATFKTIEIRLQIIVSNIVYSMIQNS
jgi:hypothetical protein